MIEKHRAQLRALDDSATSLIAELFELDQAFLIPALEARDLVQADVVMALLRAPPDKAPTASLALGQLARVIRQPCERPWPRPMPKNKPHLIDPDEWWVCWYKGCEHNGSRLKLPVAGEFGGTRGPRTKQVRVRIGHSVRDLINFGVERKTISDARRRGLLRLSGEIRETEKPHANSTKT